MEELRIEYKDITWCANHLYADNAKAHDIGGLATAIAKHGFRSPPIWDDTLGAVVAGNGRIETLEQMRRQKQPVPRGIKEVDGTWQVPVIFGLAAESVQAAIAYLIDDNNLTLMGGEFTAVDTMRMWDDGYIALLTAAAGETVSIDKEDVALMQQLAEMDSGTPLDLGGVSAEPSYDSDEPIFFVRVVFEDEQKRDRTKELLGDQASSAGVSVAEYLYDLLSQQ